MGPRSVAEVMRVLSNQAGLPTVANAHGIRHSMGRDTVRTLRSNSAVSNILGHSSIESSYVYTMLFGEDLKEQWQEVMQHRGNPIAKAPKRAQAFPKMRNDSASIKGAINQVRIKTSRNARYIKQ